MAKKIQESAREWLSGQTMYEGSPLIGVSPMIVALADRCDELEAALRELDVMLHSVPLPGENYSQWNLKAKRIVHEALGGGA